MLEKIKNEYLKFKKIIGKDNQLEEIISEIRDMLDNKDIVTENNADVKQASEEKRNLQLSNEKLNNKLACLEDDHNQALAAKEYYENTNQKALMIKMIIESILIGLAGIGLTVFGLMTSSTNLLRLISALPVLLSFVGIVEVVNYQETKICRAKNLLWKHNYNFDESIKAIESEIAWVQKQVNDNKIEISAREENIVKLNNENDIYQEEIEHQQRILSELGYLEFFKPEKFLQSYEEEFIPQEENKFCLKKRK